MISSELRVITSNRTIQSDVKSAGVMRNIGNGTSFKISALMCMAACDTAYVQVYVDAGARVADIDGTSTNNYTYFSAWLVA